jgi:hypothetical protein
MYASGDTKLLESSRILQNLGFATNSDESLRLPTPKLHRTNQNTVIPRFTSLIPPSILVRRKLVKLKLLSHYFPTGTTISLREEVARTSENWLVNLKTGINLCISYERKLVKRLLVYRRITVLELRIHQWDDYGVRMSAGAYPGTR